MAGLAPAEKHTFHPPHPTVAAETHAHTHTDARPSHRHSCNQSYADTHNNDSYTCTEQRNVSPSQTHTCKNTHTHTLAHTSGITTAVCVCVFMTSAGRSAYGPHLGTMGTESDWLDELPDCER